MDSLLRYTRLLVGYDKANVIGTRDTARVLVEHVLDSLSCLLFDPIGEAGSIIDVGAGGGLPAVPLKITLSRVHVSLVEANGKKARFLQQVVDELALEDSQVLKARAEDLGREAGLRESYEIATARALAPLSVLVEYCLPFVGVGGYVIAMKGRPTEEEMNAGEIAARTLGGKIRETIPVAFLEEVGLAERRLVIVEKFSETPGKYPRRAGTPKKRPLGSTK